MISWVFVSLLSVLSFLLAIPGCIGGIACLLQYRAFTKNLVTLVRIDKQGNVIVCNPFESENERRE